MIPTMPRRWQVIGVAIAMALTVPLSLSAQRAAKRVFVRAVDGAGRAVTDLTTADFQVTEDGVKREVTIKNIAERLADDHHLMADRYEVEFSGDAKLLQPTIVVTAAGDDVRLQMSPRRPF